MNERFRPFIVDQEVRFRDKLLREAAVFSVHRVGQSHSFRLSQPVVVHPEDLEVVDALVQALLGGDPGEEATCEDGGRA